MNWLGCLCLAPLGWLVVQDFRTRTVPVAGMLLFGTLMLSYAAVETGWPSVARHTLGNLALLLLLYAGIWGYLRVRYGRSCPPFRRHVGWGDAWFLIALTPAFDLRTYAWFLTLSLLTTLLVYGLYRRLGGRPATIPLVSALGIAFILYTLLTLR